MPDTGTREKRGNWKVAPVEVRTAEDGAPTLAAYGAVFNRYSQNLGGFVEQIAPGAFTQTISENREIYGLFNHESSAILGLNSAGTMRLEEDVTGLRYEIDLSTKRQLSIDVRDMVERGELKGSSFGFVATDVEWGLTEQDMPLRTIRSAALFDVGPVTYPAYLDTIQNGARVALRSLADSTGATLDELVDAAGRRELRSYIDGTHTVEAEQHSIPLALRRRQLDLIELSPPPGR